MSTILDSIETPLDLRKLEPSQLPDLASEIREFIVEIVSKEGGHLGASLGVVELTIALHYIFDTPNDSLIWDVGHQAYGHKILTGRKTSFHTNRKFQGLSGFPKIQESKYDAFGTGHSSTSISAALGMAVSSKLNNEHQRQHIAVIGDGAFSGGMVFEALNQAGALQPNLLVILNDNSISIDENVGALKDHLSSLKSPQKEGGKNIFENFNFNYYGPIDGHNMEELLNQFNQLKTVSGVKILHCITKKGKGYPPAESGNAVKWHAPGIFDKNTGKVLKPEKEKDLPQKYQEVFGNALVQLARKNHKIVGITPAMPSGSSLNIMMQEFPERAFDVDIAEQHAVTFAAGLATKGHIPFCAIYSTFLQRGYDQLIHDVAIQNLKVIFCIDRAGLVGEDGATHHGAYDIAYLRCIPNLIIAAPMDESELRNLMFTAQENEVRHPMAIRYPRGRSVSPNVTDSFESIKIGNARTLKNGSEVAVISIGTIGNTVNHAIAQLNSENLEKVAHYDLRFVKPIDENLLHHILQKFDKIITVEDGALNGGMGSAILEFMAEHKYSASVKRLGIPDQFVEQGSTQELQQLCGYDAMSILEAISALLKKK